MQLASVNLNKRLGNPVPRRALTSWLHDRHVEVLLAQEPWKPVDRPPVDLEGFRRIGGDGNLSAWIAERLVAPAESRPDSFVQRVELGWLVVYNVHLDAYSASVRGAQLTRLRTMVAAEDGRPVVVCGDFNLAPRPEDGVFNDRPSRFTTDRDRRPFGDLLSSCHLVDGTADSPPQFTIERRVAGGTTRFRCDLVLLPEALAPVVTAGCDHATRTFTDHSGLLVRVPVSPAPARGDGSPHRTAMSRGGASPFARGVVDALGPALAVRSVLDHGCGRGADLRHYRAAGLDADGWDPHPGFGRADEPRRQFDLVTSLFVLNVLSDPWQRIRALRHAAGFVRAGGHLLVVTRSTADVDRRARIGGWPTHHDGYWSSEARATFQKGLARDEIVGLAHHAGLATAPGPESLITRSPAATHVLLTKPA